MTLEFPPVPARTTVTGTKDRGAFTLIELLAVLAVISVLAGLSLPVISKVKESGNSAKCVSNLKEIGTAIDLYAADNNNDLPPLKDTTNDWDAGLILPYLPGRNRTGQAYQVQNKVFICPSAKYTGYPADTIARTYSSTESRIAYGNGGSGDPYPWTYARKRTNLDSLANTLLMFDGVQNTPNPYSALEVTWTQLSQTADLSANGRTSTYIDYRHSNASHGLYADGHVDKINRAQASTVITKVRWTGSNR